MRVAPTLLVLLTAACSPGSPSEAESTASGALGIVTVSDATGTISALCELRDSTDAEEAQALFFDRAHEHLHAIAAAVQEVDRAAAGRLLETKQQVEEGVQTLPDSFGEGVDELIDATREGLRLVGLPSPSCDA